MNLREQKSPKHSLAARVYAPTLLIVRAEGVLLDIDGVLAVSWQPLPGAVEAMRALRDIDIKIRFLTNTTSRSRSEIGRSLRNAGISADDEEILTAAIATANYLERERPGARCLVLNEGPLDDLGGLQIAPLGEPADVVVVGSAGPSFRWETINLAARALVNGAELLAMHGTASWQTKEGLCVDGGSYVAALERATGRTAIVVGKPAPTMFHEALASMELDSSATVMVGDDLANDVLAAKQVGITGVLVRTGKFREETLGASRQRPDAVLDSIADLPSWLAVA
jgi:HAD superfamily hydrolase (TIGR01458 family)